MTDSETYGDGVYQDGDPIEDAENLDPVENLTGDIANSSEGNGVRRPAL